MADFRPPLSKLVFKKYDADANGFIDAKELGKMVYDLGYKLTEGEVLAAIQKMDKNSDGKISCEEFSAWWKEGGDSRFSQLDLSEEAEEKLAAAIDNFKYYDTDMSGFIDRQEFKAVYENLQSKGCKLNSCDDTMKELDKNGDGKISLSEYVCWLLRSKILEI